MCLTAYRQMEMDTAAVVAAVAATHFQVAVQQERREGRASRRQCNASRPMPTGGRSRGWDRPQLAR